ncbi:MAG: hypothetical protein HQK58_16755, partial [Deltaproteobacteria bacterium]|nr:hypothetical protein [Deltaproteobacteria bacterium]
MPTPTRDDNTMWMLEQILACTLELLDRVKSVEQYSAATDKQYKNATELTGDKTPTMKQGTLLCYETATTDQNGANATEQHCIVTDDQYETATEVLAEVQPSPQTEQVKQYGSATSEQAEVQEQPESEAGEYPQAEVQEPVTPTAQPEPLEPTEQHEPPVAGAEVHPDLANLKARKDAGEEFKRYKDDLARVMLAWFKGGIKQPKIAVILN